MQLFLFGIGVGNSNVFQAMASRVWTKYILYNYILVQLLHRDNNSTIIAAQNLHNNLLM